jgi:tripartite ATP-independent transporter DctM subunit
MLLMIVLFFTLLLIGTPIAFTLGIPAIVYLMVYHPNLLPVVPLKMFRGLDSYTLLALPFFILAGNIMSRSGITEKLLEFSDQLVGKLHGGLAHVNVVTSTFFAGISGAALSDTASLGSIFIPAMVKKGYDVDFSCAITASSSVQSPLIPPSCFIVLYAAVTGASVGALFAAGIVPGLMIALTDHIIIFYLARKRNWPRNLEKVSLNKLVSSFLDALPALIMPAIILGCILGGLTTPTEAAALAVVYAVFVSLFYYRTLNLRQIPGILTDTLINCSILLFILAGSRTMAWVFEMEGLPMALTNFLFSVSSNIKVLFILINLVLFIGGCIIESGALLILLAPILAPIMINIGVNPIHFGIFFILNIVLGLITPPVGLCNFAAAAIGRTRVEGVSREIIPLVVLDAVVLVIITYIPETVLFLPRMFGFLEY